MISLIQKRLKESADLKYKLAQDSEICNTIQTIANQMVSTFKNKGKVLWCGNGGSAADAQHLAAELSGRYYSDRPPLHAEALHVNTSYVTAVANDYGYAKIYSRLIEAIGLEGDILIGLSTSGTSENVVEAFKVARHKKLITIAFTGAGGGALLALSDYCIRIPSTDIPRIQECHMVIGHSLCEFVEHQLFPN